MNTHVYERLFHWLYASEGLVPHMYVDTVGLVTVGIGFMIDVNKQLVARWENKFVFSKGVADHGLTEDGRPKSPAFPDGPRFPGRKPGEQASPDEVRKEFAEVKKKVALAGRWKTFTPLTELELGPNVDVKQEVFAILRDKENTQVKAKAWEGFYKDFDSFPPDAQMGVLSTAYGWWSNDTPARRAFHQACQAQEWHAAAESGYWDGWTDEKRRGHKLMFEHAQAAKAGGDRNPQPAFSGILRAGGDYDIDDQIRPYGQDIWKAGGR